MTLLKLSLRLPLVVCVLTINAIGQAAPQGNGGGGTPKTAGPAQRYDQNDSLVSALVPAPLICSDTGCAKLTSEESLKTQIKALRDMSFDRLREYISGYSAPSLSWPMDKKACTYISNQAIIVHLALWRTVSKDTSKPDEKVVTSLAYSSWQGYRAFWNGKSCVTRQPRASDNSPMFYGTNRAELISLDLLQSPVTADSAKISYKVSTTPTVPENLQDLGTLIEAISGAVAGPGRTEGKKTPLLNGFLTIADLGSTSAPPFSLNITESAGTPAKNPGQSEAAATQSPAQPVDCSDVSTKGCAFSRQYAIREHEFWDVAVGLVLPGVNEAVYTKGAAGALPTSSVKRHTDAYALVDIYPFGKIAPKQSYFPHFNFGVPVTSQSLHRPYVGMAENITLWAERKGFPLDICIFGGVIPMKQQVFSATSVEYLRSDHAIKGVFGVELPISQLASKLMGSKSKSTSGSASGSKTSAVQ